LSRQRSLMRLATPLMVGRGISAILTFAIPIVLARQLATREFGTYKQFFLLAGTVYLIGQAGLTASLYYFMPRHEGEDRGRYLVQTLLGLFLLGAAAAAGTMLFAGALAHRFRNPALLQLAPALAAYIWAYLGSAPLEISLTAVKKTGWSGSIYVVSDLLRTAALIVPVKLGLGVSGLAWAVAALAAARLVAAWAVALSGAVGRAAWPTRAAVGKQLRYSLPFAGAVLLATLQMQLPQFIVAALTDAAVYAVYAVGVLQIPLTDMLYTPIAEVMMVRLAQTERHGAPPVFREAVARLAMFFLPLTAFALAIAPALIPTLYTSRYIAAVPIFLIALCELPLSALPVDGLLRALDATGTLLRIGFVRLGLAAVIVPIGFFTLGLPGAMLGYVVTQWSAKTILLGAGAARLNVAPASLIPWTDVRNWSLRSLAVFGAVTALRLAGPWRGWYFLAAASLCALVVWLLCLATAGELRRARLTVLKEAHG
jgi:O-antigen/teichoic acid export membrane protein